MTTHKRKGSDFQAASVATVGVNSYSSGHMQSSSLEWKEIQQKMSKLRNKLKESNNELDQINELTCDVKERPRVWKERTRSLPAEAAAVKENIEKEWKELEQEWNQHADREYKRNQRYMDLRAELDSLTEQEERLDNEIHQIRDSMAASKENELYQRQIMLERREALVATNKKLQRKIGMYALCTGIKFDADNKEMWTGSVNVPSQESFRTFSFSHNELSPEVMADRVWNLMEG